MLPVAIIGGGISGLATAHHLAKAGIPSTIIDEQRRLGGVIRTDIVQGCVLEAGPDSFLAAKPWALDLIRELGLADEVIPSNDRRRVTYVVRRGRLVPLPEGLMLMAPTRVLPVVTSRLLGWGTKIRMGLEWLRKPQDGLPERTVAEFIGSHYGDEAVSYLAEPLLAGVYGGDPAQLSANAVLPRFVEMESRYGSLTRGALALRQAAQNPAPLFQTLKGGLGAIIEALAKSIRPHAGVAYHEVTSIERREGGYLVRMPGAWLETSHVVLACPAHRAAAILRGLDESLATLLDSIPYTSSMTVALIYDRAELRHPLDGFGFLVPKRERRGLVACTWVNTKFDHRAPAGRAVLRCFLGGAGEGGSLSQSDETILDGVLEELRRLMGIRARPLEWRIARWPASMAQYTLGHARRVEEIAARIRTHSGIHLVGNAYYGIGIPDCARMGKEVAARIVGAVA